MSLNLLAGKNISTIKIFQAEFSIIPSVFTVNKPCSSIIMIKLILMVVVVFVVAIVVVIVAMVILAAIVVVLAIGKQLLEMAVKV